MAYSMRLIKKFKKEYDESVVQALISKKSRFPGYEKLISKWDRLQVQEKSLTQDLRIMLEIANHISVANVLLDESRAYCELLEYEVPLADGTKAIDFLAHYDKMQTYCDVRTIQPEPINNWEAYKAFMQKEYLPEKVEAVSEEEMQLIKYRPRALMVEYAAEYENKIALLGKPQATIFVLTFCGDGYDWDSRLLADFADFYLTGRHNPDDPFAKTGDEYLQKNKIIFNKTINYFGYHERQKNNIDYKLFNPNIRRKSK
ncbi:MAG TPA: hypothetical protein PKN87_09685 [Syntrophomonadaceae bacterium]|nr:hypothetical protein [Syntrophomonadaceae bacterium]HNX29661.1 hypothetical protein [Syntrophomonadaceae bacterium]HPR94264.1 hypothetical protein [Syntrophomonadaceae bacterium]